MIFSLSLELQVCSDFLFSILKMPFGYVLASIISAARLLSAIVMPLEAMRLSFLWKFLRCALVWFSLSLSCFGFVAYLKSVP